MQTCGSAQKHNLCCKAGQLCVDGACFTAVGNARLGSVNAIIVSVTHVCCSACFQGLVLQAGLNLPGLCCLLLAELPRWRLHCQSGCPSVHAHTAAAKLRPASQLVQPQAPVIIACAALQGMQLSCTSCGEM